MFLLQGDIAGYVERVSSEYWRWQMPDFEATGCVLETQPEERSIAGWSLEGLKER